MRWLLCLLVGCLALLAQNDLQEPYFLASLAGGGAAAGPTAGPGLQLWWDAEGLSGPDTLSGVPTNGAAITNWTDKNFGQRLYSYAGVNSMLTNWNGRKAIYFNGNGMSTQMVWNTRSNEFTFYFAATLESASANCCFWSKGASDSWYTQCVFLNGSFVPAYNCGGQSGAATVGAPATAVFTYVFTYSLGALIYSNAVAMPMSSTNCRGGTLYGDNGFNRLFSGAPYMKGRYGEVLIYTNAHTATQVKAVTRYLAGKWGTLMPPP